VWQLGLTVQVYFAQEVARCQIFTSNNPEQGYLLPPNVREVLGREHLCFFVHEAVEKLDLKEFESRYSEEGIPRIIRRCC